MERIEEEISSEKGIFSLTGRGPTVQMVLWRAGFSPSFLEKKGKNERRDQLQAERKKLIETWKRRITLTHAPLLRDVEEQAASRDTAGSEIIDAYRQACHDTELELLEAQIENEELKAKVAELRHKLKMLEGSRDSSL
ncbi:hypothetical protein ABIA24_002091 [Sinorhizobium fredii]|uniref:hypothetical protein n=1 Tax=Rhizobium fredii TaxID=380 RepID=UPI0004B75ED8|nr:hypothetical protein [Sinorhizobium fredii]